MQLFLSGLERGDQEFVGQPVLEPPGEQRTERSQGQELLVFFGGIPHAAEGQRRRRLRAGQEERQAGDGPLFGVAGQERGLAFLSADHRAGLVSGQSAQSRHERIAADEPDDPAGGLGAGRSEGRDGDGAGEREVSDLVQHVIAPLK